MKLDFEQRQRAMKLYEQLANGDLDQEDAAFEIIGLRDKLKKLVEAADVFDLSSELDGGDPDGLVFGHLRGEIIHAGEVRRLHEALEEAEEE